MLILLKSLIAGIILGLGFCILKLPLPAPPSFGGVLGVFGVYLGYVLFTTLAK